jgi:hypothetical protein
MSEMIRLYGDSIAHPTWLPQGLARVVQAGAHFLMELMGEFIRKRTGLGPGRDKGDSRRKADELQRRSRRSAA